MTDPSISGPPKRKNIPIRIKLEACLILLGFDADEVAKRLPDFDHYPALGRRRFDDSNYYPAQLDPRYLRPIKADDHLRKTSGRKGESKLSSDGNGDTSQAAKIKRLREVEEAQALMRKRMLATEEFVEEHKKPKKAKRPWAKGRKLQGRGFQRRDRA